MKAQQIFFAGKMSRMHQFSFAASIVIEALIIVHVRQNVRLWLKHQTFFILTLNKMWVLRQLKNTIPTWACGVCECAYGIKRLFCNVKTIETNMNFKPRIPIRLDTGKISLILAQKIVELILAEIKHSYYKTAVRLISNSTHIFAAGLSLEGMPLISNFKCFPCGNNYNL